MIPWSKVLFWSDSINLNTFSSKIFFYAFWFFGHFKITFDLKAFHGFYCKEIWCTKTPLEIWEDSTIHITNFLLFPQINYSIFICFFFISFLWDGLENLSLKSQLVGKCVRHFFCNLWHTEYFNQDFENNFCRKLELIFRIELAKVKNLKSF